MLRCFSVGHTIYGFTAATPTAAEFASLEQLAATIAVLPEIQWLTRSLLVVILTAFAAAHLSHADITS